MWNGFYIGDKLISSYALCVVAGLLCACPLAVHQYKKRCPPYADMVVMIYWALPGAFIGMHLMYGITNIHRFGILFEAGDFMDFCMRFAEIFGGAVFYGGLLGAMGAALIYIRKNKMDIALTSDCAAPSVALFHCFGRIGCFLSGCCYGVPWEHGVTYTISMNTSANGVPRLPIQLIEAGCELALFAVLYLLLCRDRMRGRLFSLYLISYSVIRFILEFWRGDEYRGFLAGLSTSQILSIIILAATVILWAVKSHKGGSGRKTKGDIPT